MARTKQTARKRLAEEDEETTRLKVEGRRIHRELLALGDSARICISDTEDEAGKSEVGSDFRLDL